MGKTNLRLSAFAFLLSLAVTGAFAGSGAHAQTGWSGEASRNEPEAKRTPPPPPVQIAGSWDGIIQDSKAGNGSINLNFTETAGKAKAALKGTWTTNYPATQPEGAINDVGKLTGSVVGNSVTMTLLPRTGDALGNCRIIFNAVDATQQMISGTYHFGGCGGTNTGTISVQPGPPPTTVFINIGDDFFYPPKVTIGAGQTVRWTNNGSEDHSVNANPGSSKCRPSSGEAFDSPAINTSETFEHTFNSPGTFGYHCEIHGCPMRGTITVK